jgi:hypothetical protein
VTRRGLRIWGMSEILVLEAQKLVEYISSIGLEIPTRKPPRKHVGVIIADAVLQVGHKWKTHVKPRVERIRAEYPRADTISGLSFLLKNKSAREVLNWHGKDKQEIFYQTVKFFVNEQIDTFENLRKWLESEDNRDRLLTKSSRNDKAGIAKIADKTADYYRVLVGLPDAVKVDSRVKDFLKAAGVRKGLSYEGKRTLVQLAAKQLGKRPIDLDSAIWNYQGRNENGKDNEMESKGKGENMDKNNDKVELKIFLPAERMRQIENAARQYGEDSATLASIWVIDRLVQLGSAMLPSNAPAKTGKQGNKNITDRVNKSEYGDSGGLCFGFLTDLQQKGYQPKPLGKDNISMYEKGKPILRIFPLNGFFSVRIRQSGGNWAKNRIQVHTQEDLRKVLGEVNRIQGGLQ